MSVQETTLRVMKQLENKIMRPYLLRYIDLPIIDQEKLLMLISILQSFGLSKTQIEKCVLTVMLIQVALDTHENVTTTDESSEQKNKQLTVLAGDYYSGLYYKILAENDDIQLIRVLAGGIKDVNEHKIAIYEKGNKDIEDLMNSVAIMESALFTRVTGHYHCNNWDQFIRSYLLAKKLLIEKEKFLRKETSVIFEALKNLSYPDNALAQNVSSDKQKHLLFICDKYIDLCKQTIESGLEKMNFMNESLRQSISMIFHEKITIANTFAKEG